MIFFNGNRITFAKTYVKKEKDRKDKNQLDLFAVAQALGTPDN